VPVLVECVLTLMCHSVDMAFFAPVHPGEGFPSVALLKVSSLFFPVEGCLGLFPDPM